MEIIMKLLFDLPAKALELLALEAKEDIWYCVPYDIASDGSFQKDGYSYNFV